MKILAGIILIFLLYICIEIYLETHRFVITRYEVKTKKLPKERKAKKIIFLSDFHNQKYGEKSIKLVQAIQKEHPDLILVGGDMLVGKSTIPYTNAVDFVKQLPAIAPVYYTNGNHEQRMHEKPEIYENLYWQYKEELEKEGVVFLNNDRIVFDEDNFQIVGMELPKKCYTKIKKAELELSEMKERIGEKEDRFTILMAHHPGYAKQYWQWGADLVLSGHLHGGVVRLPFLGAAISPQYHLFPRYSGGYYKEGEQGIIVSKGLGMHTIKIRLWNPAEMVVFTLQGE